MESFSVLKPLNWKVAMLGFNPVVQPSHAKRSAYPGAGILERTGTQVDGTILVPLSYLQQEYQLAGKLTGVGVR